MERVTIKDIAAKLGVSICTVNKALTGKPRIGEGTRLRIIEEAQLMGYKPNSLARTLVRPVLKVAAVYPDAWPNYIMSLIEGVKERLAELSDYRVEPSFLATPGFRDGLSCLRALKRLFAERVDGLILIVGDYPEKQLSLIWDFLSASGMPFVLLGSGHEGSLSSRLTCVWPDCRQGGRLAGNLLDIMGCGGKQWAVFIGHRDHPDHRKKIEGFFEEAERAGSPEPIICEAFDDPSKAYPAAKSLFKSHPQTLGVYFGTDNSEGSLHYIREAGLAGRIKIVATGAPSHVRDALRDGLAAASLNQHLREQGRRAVSELFKFLETGARPEPEILLQPSVLLKTNFDARTD